VATVLQSTIIIIHTTQCTAPQNTNLLLAQLHKLTFGNTLCFYLSVVSTPAWLLAAGLPVYGAAVSVPIAVVLLAVVLLLGLMFVRTAVELNAVTTALATNSAVPAAESSSLYSHSRVSPAPVESAEAAR